MIEYHKIDTLFKREETGSNRIIIGDYRSKWVEQCKDLEWIFTEKVDGTNIRIFWNGHKVEYGGRTDKAQLHPDLIKYLDATFCTPEIEEMFEQMFGEKDVYIFGEGYGAGIQTGGAYRPDKAFILFDVMINGIFLEYNKKADIAQALGLSVVPILLTGTIDDGIDYVKNNAQSRLTGATHPLEGVVGTPLHEMRDAMGNRIIVKIKKCDFGND